MKKKGKSFSKEAEKLETDKNKTDQAKNKLSNNHSSFGNMVHRRFTHGNSVNAVKKILNEDNTPNNAKDHRHTFTK